MADNLTGALADFDDTHDLAVLHPGVAVIPAALAMAEAVGASGQALLDAVVVGYDVHIRRGHSSRSTMAPGPSASSPGWQPPGGRWLPNWPLVASGEPVTRWRGVSDFTGSTSASSTPPRSWMPWDTASRSSAPA